MSSAHANRWLLRLLVFALGLLAALMVLGDDIADWWALRTALRTESQAPSPSDSQLAAVLAAPEPQLATTLTSPAPPNTLDWWPVLQAHGLRLQRLQHHPQRAQSASGAASGVASGAASAVASGGPELSLTLQGDWRDWLAMEQQASALLTGWLPQSWQVQALGPPAAPGQVQLQWQLRWSGVTPAATASDLLARTDTAAGVAPAEATHVAPTDALVFTAAAALAEPAAQAAAPRARAVARIPWRLLGVWQQAGVAYAIVQGAGQVHALSPGQSLGQSALRVQRIEGEQVWLSEGQAAHGTRPWALGSAP